ncbi:MAG TPA: hypothetical protein VNN09_14690 [Candidatus Competibacteraceae bacterium]|nr:hypothetical protein [Candidatus Competibacteraceae bacterium]
MDEGFLRYYWNGRGPLWKAFWLYGVLGSVALTLGLLVPTGFEPVSVGYLLFAVAIASAYTVWILVAVWRCAVNVERWYWGFVARVLTLFWAINASLLLLFLVLDSLS